MLEILNGLKETIKYGDVAQLRLYENTSCESYPKHWHVGIEIILSLEGTYNVIADSQFYQLNAGDILIMHSGVIHSMNSSPKGTRLILQFDLSLLYNLKDFSKTLFTLQPALFINHESHPEIYRAISNNLHEIKEEYHSQKKLKESAIYSKIIDIYVLLCRSSLYDSSKFASNKRTKQSEYIDKLLFACEYINVHHADPLTVDEVAALIGFSKYHFSRLFKTFTSMTFHSYLNQRRIQEAQHLLMDTRLSIMDIALKCGFNSISTFTRVFKDLNTCSASDYRVNQSN